MQAKWENEFCVIMSLRETWARIKKENEKSQLESKVNFNRVGNSGRVTKNCFQLLPLTWKSNNFLQYQQ